MLNSLLQGRKDSNCSDINFKIFLLVDFTILGSQIFN